mmetsp:Transcript_42462/g.86707  ORF Transcript_42462/g.86707 Transcript_42462/m.86707 type:complete len:184 (-) Transcript_42462:53-604(-)
MSDADFDEGGADFTDDNGSDGYVETFSAEVEGDGGDAGFFEGGDFSGEPDDDDTAQEDVDEAKGETEVDRRMEWRREYNARLEEKRAASDAAVRARKEAAAKAISDYYETKETLREAKLNAGRSSEQEVIARLDEVASGNTWDRVLSLIDIKSDDPAVQKTEAMRFKTVLVQLKNEPATAGAE